MKNWLGEFLLKKHIFYKECFKVAVFTVLATRKGAAG